MAQSGNGTALFASLEERLEKKVVQQLQDSLQPSLTGTVHTARLLLWFIIQMKLTTDIQIKWDGHEQKSSTANAKPVQMEKTLMEYGKLLESATTDPAEKPQPKCRQAPTAKMVAFY